jgi:hypothetical protein
MQQIIKDFLATLPDPLDPTAVQPATIEFLALHSNAKHNSQLRPTKYLRTVTEPNEFVATPNEFVHVIDKGFSTVRNVFADWLWLTITELRAKSAKEFHLTSVHKSGWNWTAIVPWTR